ncbi:MAG: FliA/WhiG family RNA polymerase sigma factor [bacterium]
MDNVHIDLIWKKYRETKNEKAREELVLNYLPLVKYLSDRITFQLPDYIRFNDKEDIYVEGVIGLLDALERFNPELNVKFETFATKRIRGAILDSLRKEDLLPKNVRALVKKVENSMITLESLYGRPATEEELMKDLMMTNDEFYDILFKIKGVSLTSIDSESVNNKGDILYFDDIIGETGSSMFELESKEASSQLALIIEKLERKERILLEMYYWDGLTLKEIGLALNISESRACQIHTKLILQLRSGFKKLEKGR